MMKNKFSRLLPDPEASKKTLAKAWSVISNNWGWKLASIALAICLWGVLITQDTSLPRDKTIDNVRVTVYNTSTLRNNGYIVVSGLEDVGTVRIRASVPQMNYSAASADNYSARLDLSQIHSAGEHTLTITANASNAAQFGTVTEVYEAQVKVVAEEYASQTQLPVEVRTVGGAPEEYYPGALSLSVRQVDVGGPKSVVERAARCVVEFDQTNLSPSRNPNAASLPFYFEDAEGNRLDGGALSVTATGQNEAIQRINVSQQVYYKAQVPVDTAALITGAPAEGFAVSSIRVVPPYVTLAGSQEAIAPYLSEGAVLYPFEQIDISGRNQNVTSLNLALNTPGGVDYISNNAVTVIVTILPEEFVSVGGINGE